MKRLLLTAALIASTGAHAVGWEINQHGAALLFNQPTKKMALFTLAKNFYIFDIGDKCYREKDEISSILEVNGQLVNFKGGCDKDYGYTYIRSASDKGNDFILMQFKQKDRVVIGSESFSGHKFNDTMTKQTNRLKANAEAL